MQKLLIKFKKRCTFFWICLMEICISLEEIIYCILHGKWNGLQIYVPLEVNPHVEDNPQPSAKADLSSSAILEFMQTQKKHTGVFDEYILTDFKEEVSTDE